MGHLASTEDHTTSRGRLVMACLGADRRCLLACVSAALLVTGCIRPRADIRDALERRVLPAAGRGAPVDAMVRPAAAQRPEGGPDPSLPPPLEPVPPPSPRPTELASPPSPT